MAKFFKFAFATDGDKTPIPNPVQIAGTVSYDEGWGVDYQLAQTDPDYLPVPRNEMNQLFFDITGAIRQYQTLSRPDFITTADNDGVPFPYEAGAQVRYPSTGTPQTYLCKNTGAVTLPTVIADWRLMDLNAAGLIIDNVAFSGGVTQGQAVYWNAGASQFQPALANGGPANRVIGIADLTNTRVLLSGYVLNTIYGGLTVGATYYLSSTSAGNLTTVQPAVYVTPIGVAISATQLMININNTPIGVCNFGRFAQGGNQNINAGNNRLSWASYSGNASMGSGNDFVVPWTGKYRFSAVAQVLTPINSANCQFILSLANNPSAGSPGFISVLDSAYGFVNTVALYALSGSDTLELTAGTVIGVFIKALIGVGGSVTVGTNQGIVQTTAVMEYLGV